MILIAGGAWQGKTDFSLRIAKDRAVDPNETIRITDGAVCAFEELFQAKIVIHFHEFVRRFAEQTEDARGLARELAQRNPELILAVNELGYGIVPVNAADRKWREQCGRVCTAIAGQCDEVYRVVCGIGMRLR